MSELLFKLLADTRSSPSEKLSALAAQARDTLRADFLEIRVDGLGEIRMGEPTDDVYRHPVGPLGRPVGEISVAPPPSDGRGADLAPFIHCAELIYRLQAGYVDTLTGLYNRRRLDMELAGLALADSPVAIAMLDIDHFKKVNDTYGHDAGDAVLREFASRLTLSAPEGLFIARYGGEEFCVVLRGPDESAAAGVVEALRSMSSSAAIRFGSHAISITSSAGLSFGSSRRSDQLLTQADQALYAAKEGGRNQLVHAADLSKRAASKLLRQKYRRIFDRPLTDLGWFGQRVIGLDRDARRLVGIDYFGGVVPASREMPEALSFVRAGKRTYWVPAEERGLRAYGGTSGPAPAPDALPELRRVNFDGRKGRLYLIERQGRALFWTDLSLSGVHEVLLPADVERSARGITAVLPIGQGLLVLDALARQILVFDRETLAPKRTWALPPHGYELCLCYLSSLKLIMAGGADGMKLFSLSGTLVEESDRPVISAYDHPLVGLVLSTPHETMLVR